MRVIPVIDLMGGLVVRGVAGRRSEYRPIRSKLVPDSQPRSAARAFAEQFGFRAVYVADLDAIVHVGDEPPFFAEAYEQIAHCGLSLWLDAGIGTAATAKRLKALVEPRGIDIDFVIGLESLNSASDLAEVVKVIGREKSVFSIDLQDGQPRTKIGRWANASPVDLAYRALAHGLSRLIVLDLADVGTGGGTRTLGTCRQIRQAYGAAVELTAGGGVRGGKDLLSLRDAGCDAALVASALHDGRLTAADVRVLST
jgi:phosphoribosylformimino-5-aminoimidazole carboxamide ribotide isomerase